MPPFKNKCIVSKKFVKYIKIKWYKYIYTGLNQIYVF